MSSKSSTIILVTVVLGAILGGILGYYLPHLMLSLSFIGQLWVNALKVLVIPLIPASIIVAVAAMGQMKKVSRTLRNTLVYFLATSAIAVVIGLLAVLVIRPGGFASTNGAFIPDDVTRLGSLRTPEIIGSIIPDNFLLSTAGGQLLGLIIFSLVFGIVLAGMDDKKSKPVMSFVIGFNDVIAKLVNYVVYAAPIGVFFLVARAVAMNGFTVSNLIGSLGAYSFTLALAFLLHGLVILPIAAKIYGRRQPFSYLRNLLPAITTAFASGSSTAALPVTYQNTIDDSEVDSRASSMVLPTGAMINMDGTAIFLAVSAIFVGQLYGLTITPLQILLIGIMSLVLSFGSSLLPQVSLLTLAVVVNVAGFRADAFAALGLLVVVDWFWQRWRSALNVWGDAVGAAVIAETFEFKTARSTPPNPPLRRPFGKPPYERGGRGDRQSDDRRSDRKPERKQRDRSQERTSQRPPRTREQVAPSVSSVTPSGAESRETRRERPPRQRRSRTDGRSRSDSRQRPEPVRKDERNHTEEEKPFKYTLPPVPFHVLKGELAVKKTPPKPAEQEEKPVEDKESVSTTSLTQESLEHDRARIAAQLASMREREPQVQREPDAEQSEEKSQETPKPRERHYRRERVRRSEQDAETPGEDTTKASEEKPSAETHAEESREARSESKPEDTEKQEHSDKEVSFGRGRSRRGQQFKKEQKSSSNSEDDSASSESKPKEPEYSTEGASFGRGKRKKS